MYKKIRHLTDKENELLEKFFDSVSQNDFLFHYEDLKKEDYRLYYDFIRELNKNENYDKDVLYSELLEHYDPLFCRKFIEYTATLTDSLQRIFDLLDGASSKKYDFGTAIYMVKNGKRMRRQGWNGAGQYIELATNVSFKRPNGEVVNVDHEDMGNKAIAFHGTSGIQLGWLASQADMLSEDWIEA